MQCNNHTILLGMHDMSANISVYVNFLMLLLSAQQKNVADILKLINNNYFLQMRNIRHELLEIGLESL